MTASLRHRRHAERFAQLLDEADGGRRHHVHSRLDDELTELVTLRHHLVMSRPDEQLDPEFRSGLRAMLVATAEREGIGATAEPEPPPATSPPRRGFLARAPRGRTAVIAGVAVGAVTFAGVSTASENAVPGDPLYGVKRSAERAQLALASSDVGRGELYLDFARTRLVEAQAMSSDLERVLDDMDRETTQGVKLLTGAAATREDLSALGAIDRFAANQRQSLQGFTAQVSSTEAVRVEASIGLLDDVVERSDALREALQECTPATADRVDSLGPLPATCIALPAPSALQPLPQADPGNTAPAQAGLAQSGQGQSADEQPAGSTSANERSADSQTDTGAGEPGPDNASHAPDGAEGSAPAGSQDEQEDDAGLLGGLGRLVGSLLGN